MIQVSAMCSRFVLCSGSLIIAANFRHARALCSYSETTRIGTTECPCKSTADRYINSTCLPHHGGEYRDRLFSVACLATIVLGMRSCRLTNKIACASTDAHAIRVGRGSSHNVLKLK